MDPRKKQFIINTLRKASYRWPSRYKALKRTHIGRNEYFCESCGVIHGRREGAMDHVVPVVDPKKGYTTLDEYADRMFPDDEFGFQRLCHSCHDEKTEKENSVRKKTKSKKKKS